MKKIYCLLFILLFACTTSQKETVSQTDTRAIVQTDTSKTLEITDAYLIVPGKSVGYITAKTTYQDLISTFGKENLFDTIYVENLYAPDEIADEAFDKDGNPKTSTHPITYVHRRSKQELTIHWSQEKDSLQSVEINQYPTLYHTAEGLKTGIDINELALLNEAPIFFSGFGWDYGGMIQNYDVERKQPRRGKLMDLRKNGTLDFAIGMEDQQSEDITFMGDKDLNTNMPEVKKRGNQVIVSTLTIYFK